MDSFSRIILIAAVSLLTGSCARKPVVPADLSYEVVSVVPHDADAYTQGLQLVDGRLFESTGQYGHSSVRLVDRSNGTVLRKRNLPAEVFGEGLTFHGGELYVLTWKEKTAYVLDPGVFRTLRTLTYEGEGWGLSGKGGELVMSDGSGTLRFRKPQDMSVVRSVEVTDAGKPLKRLNELEVAGGEVYANIYMTDRVARIDLESGEVTGWLDLSALRAQLPQPNRAEALNGIAIDEKTGHLLITGKYWPRMFEIRLK